jgi:uncharacterized protein (DUF1800 family)
MADPSKSPLDPKTAWQAYRPSPDAPWNVERVGHLYRRATFGCTAAELERGLADGPDKTLERILSGGPGLDEFEKSTANLANSVVGANNGRQLSVWWLYRMLYTPHPLLEKLTLFWHNHFATSNGKVQNARFMYGQYELMRRHAPGNFATLLKEMSKDPAMMVWLDTRNSKKASPNENYARELMELFSLGIGHYTEKDIREAARAFTGWEIKNNAAVFSEANHDAGTKTLLGKSGTFRGEDIVRICLDQPCTAPFIVTKLYRFLISETVLPTPELIQPLADQFRSSGYDFGALVRTMLASQLFFSQPVYRTRIKSPVEFALGIVRGLEGRVGTTALAVALGEMGQDLFYPPSVKGWDGGQAWLNGQTFLIRQNLAGALTSTEDPRFGSRADPVVVARRAGQSTDEGILGYFLRLFLQGDLPEGSRQRLNDYLARSAHQSVPAYWTETDAAEHRVRTLCYLVLTLPEFQLA